MLKFCPNCGAKTLKNGKFCHECGYSLQEFNNESTITEKDIIDDTKEDIIIDNDGGDFFGDFAQVQQEEDIKNDKLAEKLERLFVNYKMSEFIDRINNIENADSPRLAYLAAMILEYGYDQIKEDGESAFNILAQLSDEGYVLADLHLIGSGFYNINEEYIPILNKNILSQIDKLEKSEDPFIIYEVANYYCSENSEKINYNKAMKLYQKAANKGYWKALASLGYIYLSGECHQSANVNKAIQYYEKAAVKGERNSALILGRLYYFEKFLPKNINKAKQWYLVAAEQNEEEALNELANIFLSEHNYYKAVEYYERNIRVNNSSLAASSLASVYLGLNEEYADFDKDEKKGISLLKKALELDQNNGDALCIFGICYAIGVGVEENPSFARDYLNKAISVGNDEVKTVAKDVLKNLNESQKENESEGCFITTAVRDSFNKPDDCYELTMFRHFRDNWLKNQPDGKELIKEYYNIAPKIVSTINKLPNASDIYMNIWLMYLKPCLKYIEANDNISCKNLYFKMVQDLKEKIV